jgi:hypothetical protein
MTLHYVTQPALAKNVGEPETPSGEDSGAQYRRLRIAAIS